MSGIWRSVSTGNFIMNNVSYDEEYIDNSVGYEKKGLLSIFSIFPGNIKEITILPNEKWCLHSNSFLAGTSNIDITTGGSMRSFIGGQSLFYTKAENNSNSNGKVWLISYGGIIEKPLKINRKFLIHAGLFLATKEEVYNEIKLGLSGSMFSSYVGEQGIMINFSETTTDDIVYLQSGNIYAFLDFISNYIIEPENSNKNKLTDMIGNSIANSITSHRNIEDNVDSNISEYDAVPEDTTIPEATITEPTIPEPISDNNTTNNNIFGNLIPFFKGGKEYIKTKSVRKNKRRTHKNKRK